MRVLGTTVLLACWLLGAMPVSASANAARPVKGALYVDYDAEAKLRVWKSGRRLSPRSSIVTTRPGCGAPPVRFDGRPRPVLISKSGRFRVVERTGRFVLRVRGRFA